MRITWQRHSCFVLEGSEGSIVFDPYAPGSVPGTELPSLKAGLTICSHGHNDHNWAEGIVKSGEYTGDIKFVDSFHDDKQGKLRGSNKIAIVKTDGKTVCHMGDLGHELNEEQLREIGHVDVLLIPVGGFFTIDAKTAKAIADAIAPDLVIPMHYRNDGVGYPVIGEVDAFTALYPADDVIYAESRTLEFDKAFGGKVMVLPVD